MHSAPLHELGPGGDFDRWELDLTANLVRDFLSARASAPGLEFDDLLQECLLHWWSRRSRFDKRRGASRETFLRRVVKAKLLDIERGLKAGKRGAGLRPVSLDAPACRAEPDGPSRGDALPASCETEADVASAADRQRLIARLSPRQRELILGLEAGIPKTELGKRLKISRDTIYAELERIRKIFRDEELAPFLE